MRSIEELKKPKEVIRLNATKKFNFSSVSGVGEILISAIDDKGKKEWHLTMGNRKMVKEFGMVLEEVRQNKYVGPRQLKRTLGNVLDSMFEHKMNKIETPFISDIKELQQKRKRSEGKS